MMLNISINFHENILNGFQVMEQTQIYHCQILKWNSPKTIWTRVTALVFCTLPDDALYLYEIWWKYLVQFSSYRADTDAWQMDGQTDGQTAKAKTISLPSVRGRHNNTTTRNNNLLKLRRSKIASLLVSLQLPCSNLVAVQSNSLVLKYSCKTKICYLQMTCGANQEIGWLQVLRKIK